MLGLLWFVPPLCKAVWEGVGVVGNVDFLVTHAHDLGWMGQVIGWLLNPPGWSILPMILVGLVLIWWDSKRSKAMSAASGRQTAVTQHSEPALPLAVAGNTKPATAPGQLPVVPRPKPLPVERPASEPAAPDWDWGKLFSVKEDAEVIQLRFLPDTKDAEADALLLIVYGYKVLKGHNNVRRNVAHAEVARALREAPNARLIAQFAPMLEITRELNGYDYGTKALENGNLRRVKLSQGGFYELTPTGESQAKSLARDLIDRA